MKRSATLIVVLSLGLCSHGALGQAQSSRITYTTIDVPGALYTSVRGINSAGMMVGDSSTSPIGGGAGFLFKNGHFRHFSYPGGDSTFAYHVNDSGLVVGTVLIGGAAFYGYTYDGTNFQNITIPGYPYTSADGLNNAGVIVGGATGSGNIVFELSGTKSKNITPPPGGYSAAYATGINKFNRIVGWTTGASTTGFQYKGGEFKTMVVPGAGGYTEAWGINDIDMIVGWYQSLFGTRDCGFCGFVFRHGKYITLNYPGAKDTVAYGINNAGQIVGAYDLGDNHGHGFVTSPITAADFDRPGCCLVDPNWKEQ